MFSACVALASLCVSLSLALGTDASSAGAGREAAAGLRLEELQRLQDGAEGNVTLYSFENSRGEGCPETSEVFFVKLGNAVCTTSCILGCATPTNIRIDCDDNTVDSKVTVRHWEGPGGCEGEPTLTIQTEAGKCTQEPGNPARSIVVSCGDRTGGGGGGRSTGAKWGIAIAVILCLAVVGYGGYRAYGALFGDRNDGVAGGRKARPTSAPTAPLHDPNETWDSAAV